MNDENNNNQNLTKVFELIQKNNEQNQKDRRFDRIIGFGQTALMLIPTFILIYKSFQKQKLTPKQRLMRNRATQARLKLDEEHILQEALHEAELKQMETGLDSDGDILSSLKQKGKSLLKDKVAQVNKAVDEKVNQVTDKLKVDKIFDKEKKE